MITKFQVDQECAANNFWAAMQRKISNQETDCNVYLKDLIDEEVVYLKGEEAKELKKWLESQRHWDSYDYSLAAPHPVFITEVEENDDDYKEWLDSRNWQ